MFLKDYPFDPKCSPENLEKAREYLQSVKIPVPTSSEGRQNKLSCGIFSVSGDRYVRSNLPCHAMVGHPAGVTDRECVATTLYCSPEAATWNDWLIHRSFASYFILNKDTAIEDGGIVISSDIPAPLVQFICIASRAWILCYTRESVPHWEELVKAGLSEEAAYYFTCNLTVSSTYVLPIDHTPWSHVEIGVKGLINFCNHDFGTALEQQTKDGKTYRTDKNYLGTTRYCTNGASSLNIFRELHDNDPEYLARLRAYRDPSITTGESSPITNPFKKKNSSEYREKPSWTPKTTEFFDVIVPYFVEKKMFNSGVN